MVKIKGEEPGGLISGLTFTLTYGFESELSSRRLGFLLLIGSCALI